MSTYRIQLKDGLIHAGFPKYGTVSNDRVKVYTYCAPNNVLTGKLYYAYMESRVPVTCPNCIEALKRKLAGHRYSTNLIQKVLYESKLGKSKPSRVDLLSKK